jgi:hypothetical protein
MIEDILKERKPGDKPRFFLHDEMKLWLKDNLKIYSHAITQGQGHSPLQNKLNLSAPLPNEYVIQTGISMDGEQLSYTTVSINLRQYEQALQTMSNVVETCMKEILILQHDNKMLKELITHEHANKTT